MRPPELHIVLPVEGKASAFVTAMTSAEADDLRGWILAHEDDLRDQVSAILDQAEFIRSKPETSA